MWFVTLLVETEHEHANLTPERPARWLVTGTLKHDPDLQKAPTTNEGIESDGYRARHDSGHHQLATQLRTGIREVTTKTASK